MLYLPLATSMFVKSLSVISESTENCCSFNTFWKFFLSIVLLWILLPPQLEAHNCALDTPWQVQGLRRTLQGWLDTREKGNITGETGELTFRFHKKNSGIYWSWAGGRWQDGYFYSEDGERKPNFNSSNLFKVELVQERGGTAIQGLRSLSSQT